MLRFTRIQAQRFGPSDARISEAWNRCYPNIMKEKWRDMYHSYYPYLFEHGESMSLYPKIPSNPREWQPGQLQTTYDAIREDRYDAFIRIREKYPELYQDTRQWDKPPPFGEFNQMYSVRFGLIGTKIATQTEYDEHGNKMDLTVIWVPDNQVVDHRVKEKDGKDAVIVGAMNVPVEFHKPYITSAYKAKRVPVKHVRTTFNITPDAFVPIGTKLDVRHFKVGQEVNMAYQYTDFGFQGTMKRFGHDGGPVWLGDSKWQRRMGGKGAESLGRLSPGTRGDGQTGAYISYYKNIPVYRIDYKNSLIYLAQTFECDIGCYVRLHDVLNFRSVPEWNTSRGLPSFPTFVPPEDEDLQTMSTEDCQLVSLPLYHRLADDMPAPQAVSQEDVDENKPKPVEKKDETKKFKFYDKRKFQDYQKKYNKMRREKRKQKMKTVNALVSQKQDEQRQKKRDRSKKVKR